MLTEVASGLKFDKIGVMDAQEAANSSLNPNAPYFFPSAFLEVEDFSSEWWNLVQTSPAFRDYWIQERMQYMDGEELTDEDFDQPETFVEFMDQETFVEFMDQEPDQVIQDENFIQKVDASDFEGVSEQDEHQKQLLEKSMKSLDLKAHIPEAMQQHDQKVYHNKAPLSPSKFPSISKKSAMHRIQQPR